MLSHNLLGGSNKVDKAA